MFLRIKNFLLLHQLVWLALFTTGLLSHFLLGVHFDWWYYLKSNINNDIMNSLDYLICWALDPWKAFYILVRMGLALYFIVLSTHWDTKNTAICHKVLPLDKNKPCQPIFCRILSHFHVNHILKRRLNNLVANLWKFSLQISFAFIFLHF